MLGMIRRTIKSRSANILLNLYKTLVRPHLEYALSAWSPYYKKDRELLERIQHRFSKMVEGMVCLEYRERLRRLGLWTLEERRNRGDLLEVYKISKGLSKVAMDDFFHVGTGQRTRGHSLRVSKKQSAKDFRLHFFSQRVVNRWNALDQETVDAPSLNSFKNGLQRIHSTKIGFFED